MTREIPSDFYKDQLFNQMKIELHNLVEIYKEDSRDCSDRNQCAPIWDAMQVLNRVSFFEGKKKEYDL